MKILFKPAAIIITFLGISVLLALKIPVNKVNHPQPIEGKVAKKIQVAVLLDVSNSMDGLIDQAKAQLWNMVSVMGKAKCNDVSPEFEIALYEYGRSSNETKKGL